MATNIESGCKLIGIYPFNPPHLLHTLLQSPSTPGPHCIPLGLILSNNQEDLTQDMMPMVESAYTRLLANNMMMKANLKARRDADAAEEARNDREQV